MYSPQLLDHFEHPRNSGVLQRADASVQVENPVCGDVLRLSANLKQGYILPIKFLAKGCVPAIACASALTELVSGRTIERASELSREEILEAIGSLPEASSHAIALALDALRALLKDLRNRSS